MKYHNLAADKVICLADSSEEPPNKVLAQRLQEHELEQVEAFKGGLAAVKEELGEEVAKEVAIEGTEEEVLSRVRRVIDPFYAHPDNDDQERVSADVQEDDEPILWGPCDSFCPVVARDGWLLRGKEEFEAGFQGRRYRFYGEPELNRFKEEPATFAALRPELIPPRVLLIGPKGIGLRTLLNRLN